MSTSAAPVWTVRTLLVWARDWLEKKGIDSPRLDAELLLARALSCDRVRLYIDHEKPLGLEDLAKFKELIQRRAAREPVAYILGEKEFYGRPFALDARSFIPRPETELVVQAALQALDARAAEGAKTGEGQRGLDLCAGSGAIGVTLAAERAHLLVDLVELAPGAAEVTAANALRHAAGRCTVHTGDLFAPLTPGTRYDVIVANPPYVPEGDRARLAPEITLHEPALALFGGRDGLDVIRRLLTEAPRWLCAGASLVLELDPAQKDVALDLATRAGLLMARVEKDLAGLSRLLIARVP